MRVSAGLSPESLREVARLPDAASRTQFFGTHPEFLHAAIVEQLADAVSERVHVDVNEAAALSEAAIVIAEAVGKDDAMARALRARANAHRYLNELKPAVARFDEAARLFERHGNIAELGRTLSSSIKAHILLGDYARALDAAGRAETIFTALGDRRRLARLDINVANILHRQDRFAEALDRYERACARLVSFGDVEGIGVALHNMAVCLIVLNDFERALATYERARAHCARAGMRALVAQADYNIASLYFYRGDYSRAVGMLRAARVACSTAGDLYHAALCSLDQAEIYLELNLSAEAAEMAQEARTTFERLGNGHEAARAVTNLALALGQQNETDQALELLTQARSQFEREDNVAWPSMIDLYRAALLASDDRHLESRPLALAALTAFRALGFRRKEARCELLLARNALATDAVTDAVGHCRRALALADECEAPVLAHEAHFLMGQIEEASKNPARAYLSYREARDRLESLRGVLSGDDLKMAFMTRTAAVYERLVDLCMRHQDPHRSPDEIFGYIEDAKSRSLRDAFFERPRLSPPAGSRQRELAPQMLTLREELNWYHRRIEAEQLNRDGGSLQRLEALQAELQRREQAFIRALREMPPADRVPMGIRDASIDTTERIRAALRPGTTLVEYFRTDDKILAVRATRDDIAVVPLTTVSRVRSALRLLQFQLSKFQLEPEYLAQMGESLLTATQLHLYELHQELFAPLALKDGGHIVVVPHDALHCVPFHALFDGGSYVADTRDVSYAPSASIYALCGQRPVPSTQRSLVLGVPDERAPYILDEVQAVARLLPQVETRVGKDASIAALRELGPRCRTVHVATHGQFREDSPLFSGVRLADSFLTPYDLASLPLPVDLVTLSGCGTGLNVVSDGDELQGLTRGLLAAGARSLLVTLWDVHDRSTAAFMTFFYRGIEAGLSKAAALRAAAAELRREYPHPYYWAPFVLTGADM